MSGVKKFNVALSVCLLWAANAGAQYYDWGTSPVNVRWRSIKTPDVKLIYPADFEESARRTLWYLDTVRTHIGYGFRHGTMRTPVVIHSRNTQGNGMVMWAPKRIELLAAPGATYSEPWLKQLAIHEYRHNVQFNNLRRGVMRPLTWLLGQQIAFVGSAQFSIYITEGDAVMAETELSAFGRGLQPSWTMHYRAAGDVGTPKYTTDYWFSGSFRDYVPDHYHIGYQMVRWSYDHFGNHIWDDVAHYVARNSQFIVPIWIRMNRYIGLSQSQLFHRAFADLNSHWQSLPRVDDSSMRIDTPENSYTTYRWPLWLDNKTLVAFKSDLKGTNRLVRVTVNGSGADYGKARRNEKVLGWTGQVSSRPALDADGVLWWTEFRRSLLWDERVSSRLVSRDLASGRRRTHPSADQVLYPTPVPDNIAYVAYNYSGRFSIVNGNRQLDLPHGVEVTGLAWDDVTAALYFIGLDDGGMFLGKAGAAGTSPDRWQRLTPSRHITISDLRAGGGRLYFGSIVSGKDEAHFYDLATATEYRLSTSTYGSFQPSTPGPDGRVAITTYDRHGYHLALQNPATAAVQEQRTLPVDLVNPAWKRWEVASMDGFVYTPETAERSAAEYKSRRFSKIANILQPHSWVPADFYPPAAISEADLTANIGATIISQSLLSDAVSWLAYGWNPRGGSMMRGGMSYRGLGPTIDVDFTWGGASQVRHTQIPDWLPTENKKHLEVTTRISLPMTVSSGRWYSSVTPSAEYQYSNGLLFRTMDDEHGKLTRGLERLVVSLRYSGRTRTALSEFLPRWGFTARISHVSNPTNSDFAPVWTASAATWLPGIVRPHSLKLQFAMHQTPGNSKGPYTFRVKELFPRGAFYNFSARQWRSTSIDYQFPFWYPEGGITSIIYFKRVRLNLFADYALWKGSDFNTKFNRLHSLGADLIIDMNPLRLPATNHLTTTLTIAKPSDRQGVCFNASLAMPF
ncbi:MAG: hypothetical protein LBU98_03870 [Alistipes sp.]|jgi:hypothetical protein|nr:hypothetical protein [Alistipes sp.]